MVLCRHHNVSMYSHSTSLESKRERAHNGSILSLEQARVHTSIPRFTVDQSAHASLPREGLKGECVPVGRYHVLYSRGGSKALWEGPAGRHVTSEPCGLTPPVGRLPARGATSTYGVAGADIASTSDRLARLSPIPVVASTSDQSVRLPAKTGQKPKI